MEFMNDDGYNEDDIERYMIIEDFFTEKLLT